MPTGTEMIAFTTQPCILCHKSTELQVDAAKLKRWRDGEHIQNVWPELSPDEREMLMTGTHAECWDSMFPEEEE